MPSSPSVPKRSTGSARTRRQSGNAANKMASSRNAATEPVSAQKRAVKGRSTKSMASPGGPMSLAYRAYVNFTRLDDSHLPPHLGKRRNRRVNVGCRMGRRHLGADAVLALGHHREEEARHIDAFVIKLVCHLLGEL